jgi:hypothetical protein
MGVVTNPAAETSLTIADDVEVMKVRVPVSETGVGFSITVLEQGVRMALKAKSVSFRIIRNILPCIKKLHRKGRFSLVRRMAVRAVSRSYGFVKISGGFNVSANIPVALKTVTS